MLGALTFGAKYVMAPLPNIEPVSLFVMLFGVVFGWKALWPVGVYVAMEILVYGIQLWNINYLYVWGSLAVAAWLLKKFRNPFFWATVSGLFGMAFGLLCSPVYVFIGGFDYARRWWLAGLPYDIPHCIGNFIIALVLFEPLRILLTKLYRKYIR